MGRKDQTHLWARKHLWAGEWESDSRDRVAAPKDDQRGQRDEPTEVPEPQLAPRLAPERRRAVGRRRAAASVGLVVVVALAVAGGLVAFNGDSQSSGERAALPAAPTATVAPQSGQTQAGAIYKRASPAVVSIRTGSGSGTGFLVDPDGLIVTNAHVVGSANEVEVRFGAKGQRLDGEVAGIDPSSDLALIRIDPAGIPSGVSPLKFADSSRVAVGDEVLAIGNPFGLDRTQTAGIVSGIGRDIRAPNGFQISDAIQTDAAINPGNSGGPLIDSSGNVVGVNSQIETSGPSSGNVGIGFAVPSNTARKIVPALEAGDPVEHPWLGIEMEDDPAAQGARVSSVTPNGAADRAGIREGDLITEFGSESVADSATLGSLVGKAKPGEEITVKVRRGGRVLELEATLRSRPAVAP